MGRSGLKTLLALVLLTLSAAGAQAQMNWLPELRGGFYARGVDAPGGNLLDPARYSDANVELLFNAPDLNAWVFLGEVRPHLGVSASLTGADSMAYAGLSWTVQAPILPVFVEASAGAVARSTLLTAPVNDPSRAIGCGLGLRVAGSAGLQLPLGFSLVATVEHLPDFGSCGVAKRAATNLGVRVGYRF